MSYSHHPSFFISRSIATLSPEHRNLLRAAAAVVALHLAFALDCNKLRLPLLLHTSALDLHFSQQLWLTACALLLLRHSSSADFVYGGPLLLLHHPISCGLRRLALRRAPFAARPPELRRPCPLLRPSNYDNAHPLVCPLGLQWPCRRRLLPLRHASTAITCSPAGGKGDHDMSVVQTG